MVFIQLYFLTPVNPFTKLSQEPTYDRKAKEKVDINQAYPYYRHASWTSKVRLRDNQELEVHLSPC